MAYCVNDGAVMKAWAKALQIEGSFLKFFGDPYSDLTRSLDMVLDHPGPRGVGLINRCKRFVMLFHKGVAKFVAVAETDDDPAGDAHPDKTLAEAVLKFIDDHHDEM